MYQTQVKVTYWEQKQADITLQTPKLLDQFEAEEMALKELAEKFPEAQDPVVKEVIHLG